MPKRSKSSSRWLQEHFKDTYVKKAHQTGARSRAFFKLKEINERDRILKPGMTVVDLGAAPGGWSQHARPLLGPKGRLIAFDILPMEPLKDVEFLLGDFREETALRALEALVGAGRQVDLVLSDMAPNITGIDTTDAAAIVHLGELALDFARQHLKVGGAFLTKVFQGEGIEAYTRL